MVIINVPIAFGYSCEEEKETRVIPKSEESKIAYSLVTKKRRKSFANIKGAFANRFDYYYVSSK